MFTVLMPLFVKAVNILGAARKNVRWKEHELDDAVNITIWTRRESPPTTRVAGEAQFCTPPRHGKLNGVVRQLLLTLLSALHCAEYVPWDS